VRFDQKVKGAAARTAVLQRLQVTTTPAVVGAWRWYNSYEVHYRGKEYWKKGTTVSITAALQGLRVPGTDVWGADTPRTGSFKVGSAVVSTADLLKHTLTVTQDGKVLKVLAMSAGREKYPTKGGVHIVLLKEKVHLFNSATVGIPTASPEGYYKKLPWSVRISNGGAFVHSQPGSIRAQGFRNVSHGCINLNPTNAEWFFGLAKKGDIVNVTNAVVPPLRSDAGMSDWNYSWAEWSKGNLDG
jgi:lipoprotein-anchoring transpeptidase ErfK/SrfK